jgi:hypothetical protein
MQTTYNQDIMVWTPAPCTRLAKFSNCFTYRSPTYLDKSIKDITSSERPKPKYGRYRKLPTFRFPQIATDTDTEMSAETDTETDNFRSLPINGQRLIQTQKIEWK